MDRYHISSTQVLGRQFWIPLSEKPSNGRAGVIQSEIYTLNLVLRVRQSTTSTV